MELLIQESEDNQAGGRKSKSIVWVPHVKMWAKIENLSGKSRFNHNQQQAELTHTIEIRYRKDITRKNRVRYKGREFKIIFIANKDEADRFLILHVKEDV